MCFGCRALSTDEPDQEFCFWWTLYEIWCGFIYFQQKFRLLVARLHVCGLCGRGAGAVGSDLHAVRIAGTGRLHGRIQVGANQTKDSDWSESFLLLLFFFVYYYSYNLQLDTLHQNIFWSGSFVLYIFIFLTGTNFIPLKRISDTFPVLIKLPDPIYFCHGGLETFLSVRILQINQSVFSYIYFDLGL